MRVAGEATVAPVRSAQVQAGVDGVVKNVFVREGDFVRQGTVLAEMEDWNYRADLAGAEAKYAEAMATMNRALAQNDGALAGLNALKSTTTGRNWHALANNWIDQISGPF